MTGEINWAEESAVMLGKIAHMKILEGFAVNKHNLKHGLYYIPVYSDKELSFKEVSLDDQRYRKLPVYKAVIENDEITLKRI